MLTADPRTRRPPFPKSNRSRRRARKQPGHRSRAVEERLRKAEVERQKKLAAERDRQQRERDYFARWPESTYPGRRLPKALGRFRCEENPVIAERQRIWLRSFERWQQVRARFFRFEERRMRSLDERIIINATALFYRDMRFWEARRCGFNAADEKVWKWWVNKLFIEQRLSIIADSQKQGLRFIHRRAWQPFRGRRAA